MFFMFHILVIIISNFESVCCTSKILNQDPLEYTDESFKISSFKDAVRNETSTRKPLFYTLLKSKNLKSNVFDKMLSDEMFSIKQRFFDHDLAYTTLVNNIFSQTTPHTPTLEVRQKWPVVDLLTKPSEDQIENEKFDSKSNDDLDKANNENLSSNMNYNLDQIESEELDSSSNVDLDKINNKQLGLNMNANLDEIESKTLGSKTNDYLNKIDNKKLGSSNELNTDAEAFDEQNLVQSNEVNTPLKKNLDVRCLGPSKGIINYDRVHTSTKCSCMRQGQHFPNRRQEIQTLPVIHDTYTSHNPDDCSRTTITYSVLPFYYPYSMYPPFFINDEVPQPQKIYYQPPIINNVKIPKKTKKRKTTKYSEEDLYYDDSNSKEDFREINDDKDKNILLTFDYDTSADKKRKPEHDFLAELDQVYDAKIQRKCYCSSGKIIQNSNIYIYCIFSMYFIY